MKLADLIPARSALDTRESLGWNVAIAQMETLAATAEAAGYRLVLAMPQHIDPMEDDA